MDRSRIWFCPALLAIVMVVQARAAAADVEKYKDLSLPPDVRAADLVSRMTLEEKVAQLSNHAPAIDRLGVAAYDYWSEALHGVARNGDATLFPAPIGLAATFDPQLVHDIGDAISTEARAKYHEALRHGEHGAFQGLTFWSPNINLFRDPRWGRGHETFGEDPFLTGRMGVAFIRGIQGDDRHYLKAAATAKHFAVHSGPEDIRYDFNARPSERDLYDSYLPHFEAAVREGHVVSVMGAYNALYGEPCCANELLLTKILRDRWGFAGFVVSDCGAIGNIFTYHQAAPNQPAADAKALKAGCDLECGSHYAGAMLDAMKAGLVSQPQIDTALVRVFTVRFRLGMFDPDDRVPFAKIEMDQVHSAQHATLARKAAAESLVLLENDRNTLPLDRARVRRLAVVGPNADSITPFYGNYSPRPATCPSLVEAMSDKLGTTTGVIAVHGCTYAPSAIPFEVVPDICLRHDDAQPGLKAEYFTNPDLDGQPSVTRADLGIDFCYYWTAHLPAYPTQNTSARWTGELVAPEAGDYTLAVYGREPVRLWLDGKLVIDEWEKRDRVEPLPAQFHLTKDQVVALKLEYSHDTGTACCALLWDRGDIDLTARIVERVKEADAIVFASGLNGDIEGEAGEPRRPIDGIDGDRAAIELPAVQSKLIRALAATGKPLIIVNFSGGAMAMPTEAQRAAAIVQAWYPGEAGATAIADLLFGDASPSGRLPLTFYRATSDLPAFDDYAMKGRTYRFFARKPLWSFGHGLGYTKFEYGNLVVQKANDLIRATFDLSNVGARDGDELVQLYVRRSKRNADDPLRDLRALQRVSVNKGAMQRVTLVFPTSSLRHWDVQRHDYIVDPGEYEIEIGAASDDVRLRGVQLIP
jgi:beta-glucosidase